MRSIYFLYLLFFATGCSIALTNYDYFFVDGGYVDLKKGKYILNVPYTNSNKARLTDTTYKTFKKILGDSLFLLNDLRKTHTVAAQYPFDLSVADMKKLYRITNCDYFISIKAKAVKKRGSVRINSATVQMRIYDLRNAVLITDVVGTARNEIDEGWLSDPDKSDIIVANGADALMLNALVRLVKKYRKQKI